MTEPSVEQAPPPAPSSQTSLVQILRGNAMWWAIPALLVVALVLILVLLTETAAAPFVYAVF